MSSNISLHKMRELALSFLRAPTKPECFDPLLQCLIASDAKHADALKRLIRQRCGLSSSLAPTLVLEFFPQRLGIAYTADCVEHVISESTFESESPLDIVNEARDWLAGNATKKEVLSLIDDVAQEATDWQKKWYKWYYSLPTPINQDVQNRINASEEPLFIYHCALSLAYATQPSEKAKGTTFGHYRKWLDDIDEALSRSLEAVGCRAWAPLCSVRERKLVRNELQWQIDRLAELLGDDVVFSCPSGKRANFFRRDFEAGGREVTDGYLAGADQPAVAASASVWR